MQQNCRNIYSVRARHTIFTVVARNCVELHHAAGGQLQEFELFFAQRFERAVGFQVVLQMFHACHAAQHGKHARERACKTKSPGGHAYFRLALLEQGYDIVGYVRQTTAQKRFHYNCGYVAFCQFVVKVFRIGVALVYLLCIPPVKVVKLNLNKVPFIFVMLRQKAVEHSYVSMVGKTNISYASGLALFYKEIENAVVYVTFLVFRHRVTAAAHAMQQHVIDVIGLHIL